MSVAMIWGASGGIGRALLQQLSEAQWTRVALSRDISQLPNAADLVIEADPCDPFSVEEAVYTVGSEVSEVDLWIYAAGDITSVKAAEMKADEWRRILDANLTGAFLSARASLPLLAPDAHLFFLGAYSEKLRLPGLSAYASAKAGLEAFTETLAKEERQRKIVNVRPGAVDTSLWDKVPLRPPKGALEAAAVAQKILAAYEDDHQGRLDI